MIGSFVELLAGQAPREAYEQLVADAELAGDPAAGTLRALLPQALQVRDTLERQRTREAELSALYATAQDLTAIRDVQQILQAIVRRARQLLGTDIAYLGLNAPEDDAAYIQVTDGAVSASFRNLKLPLGTGLLGLVAQTGVPYATPDYHHDDRFTHRDYIDDAVGDESIRAILGVPMTVNGEVIGALLAANRTPRPFPPEEVELLSSFAAHAAVALENARLFQQTVTSSERVREQSAAVQAAADVHDRLTRVLLRGGDAGDVAAVLADALTATVTVLAPDGRLLAGAGAGADGEDGGPDPDAVSEALTTGRSVRTDDGSHVAVAAAGTDHLGTLVVADRSELTEAELRTLERAALVTALLLLFARTVAEAEDRVREDLLDDLLDAADRHPTDVERLHLRATRHGVDLDAQHVVLTAVLGSDDRRLVLALGSRLAAEHAGLATVRGAELVLLLSGEDPVDVGQRLRPRLAQLGDPVTIGAAGPVAGLGQVAAAYREARQSLRALLALGRHGDVADGAGTGVARLLLGASGPAEAEEFLQATIGPLLAHDAARGTDLVATVDAWFAAQGSATRAGRALHVHTNTVTQRLERVDALLGADWRDPARALDVQLALRLRQLQRMG